MTMVLEIPDVLKSMFAPLKDLVACAAAQVEKARGGGPVEYESFEQRLAEKSATVERSAHQATLSALDVDAPKILINGELHARVGRHETTFMTQPGEVPWCARSTAVLARGMGRWLTR